MLEVAIECTSNLTLFEFINKGIVVTKATIDLRQHKFNVTSQGGENGIVEKIFQAIGTNNQYCVEFGGFDIKHFSNVYPLWSKSEWKGLLIEGDNNRYQKLVEDYEALRQNEKTGGLDLENAFVESHGVNSLDNILQRHNFPKDIDLISIDVDGTDYSIWKSLKEFRPRVMIIEFNPTVPPHISMIGRENGNHVGAGIKDILDLGKDKGYSLVACTIVNAILVADEESEYFLHKNDLNYLFDNSRLTYAISTFGGGVFLSRQPVYNFNLFTLEYKDIDNRRDFFFFPPLWKLAWMAARERIASLIRNGRLIYR